MGGDSSLALRMTEGAQNDIGGALVGNGADGSAKIATHYVGGIYFRCIK